MRNSMNKKRNNKGFSLVELIVVVAIMAVLVGVLAPAYLRYVEKSRLQKDVSAVAEVVEAAKIAAAEEDVYNLIGDSTDPTEIGIGTTGVITVDGVKTGDIYTAITTTVGTSINLSSSTGKSAATTIKLTKANGSVTVAVDGPSAEFDALK